MANILVVDDELGIRDLLQEILNDEGHAVEVAENAQQAREARQRERPDLVLLDIWMPDTDGVTLLKEWSSAGALTMPVIMMSGHATIDTAVEATKIGALAFLEKPITMQKLLKAVEQGLARGTVRKLPPAAYIPVIDAVAVELLVECGPDAMAGGDDNSNNNNVNSHNGNVNHLLPRQSFGLDKPLREARDEFEKAYFEYHLSRENGSMTRVAE